MHEAEINTVVRCSVSFLEQLYHPELTSKHQARSHAFPSLFSERHLSDAANTAASGDHNIGSTDDGSLETSLTTRQKNVTGSIDGCSFNSGCGNSRLANLSLLQPRTLTGLPSVDIRVLCPRES